MVSCNADGSSGSEDWGNADVLKLTRNGTGNNAFPAFSSDGSEVSLHHLQSFVKSQPTPPQSCVRSTDMLWEHRDVGAVR